VSVLRRHVNGTGVNQDILDVLNWAERGNIISNLQKVAISCEFLRPNIIAYMYMLINLVQLVLNTCSVVVNIVFLLYDYSLVVLY
jgi:hypothetical protein